MSSLTSLTKSQVPQFLVGSEFYNSLSSDDDNEEFSIPSMHMKMTPDIHTPSDLAHYLHTIQFWGFRKFPNDFIAFLKRGVKPDFLEPMCDVLREFEDTFHLEQLFRDLQGATSPKMLLEAAAKCVRKDVLEYLISFGKPVNVVMAKLAAEHGHLDLLERTTTELRAARKDPFAKISLKMVASGGHSACLRFLWENGHQKDTKICLSAAENGHLNCLITARNLGCACDRDVANAAALHGHIKCLEYALNESGSFRVEAACNAALRGHVSCLELIFSHRHAPVVCDSKRVANAAAAGGHMDCMVYVHERGCPWDFQCAKMAAGHGHFAILQYVVQEGCPVNFCVADAAAAAGHLDILRFVLHDCGVLASDEGVDAAAQRGHTDCLKMLCEANVPLDSDLVLGVMAEHKNDQYVRRLVEAGFTLPATVAAVAVNSSNNACLAFVCAHQHCTLTAEEAATAAARGDLKALKILHQHGCPWDENVCYDAALNGHLECLRFLREHGCPWDYNTASASVWGGHLKCLQYVVQHGCELDTQTGWIEKGGSGTEYLHTHVCAIAIENGYLDCLRFLVEQGVPLDASLCVAAVKYKTCYKSSTTALQLLRCLHEARCPWDVTVLNAAAQTYAEECVVYLLAEGCPRDETTTAAAAAAYWSDSTTLQLLHEAGCPWDVCTTAAAARSSNTNKLKYAHEHGCPWDESACRAAAASDRLACLQFLHEHGCPWDLCTSHAAWKGSQCLSYCVENGCPIDEDVMKKYNEGCDEKGFDDLEWDEI